MKVTIKQIKEHAKVMKSNGAKGINAWNRFEMYLAQFENVAYSDVDGFRDIIDMRVYIRGSWRQICGDIIDSGYFWG